MKGGVDQTNSRVWQTLSALVIGALASLLLIGSAQAATRTVGTTKDKGSHSLRKTIRHAKPGDTVKLPKGTYQLSKGEIPIAEKLTIKGAGSDKTKISAGRKSRIFNLATTASPVQISKLKLTAGKAPDGGAILNAGSLRISKATLSGNRTSGTAGAGGAIANSGTLTVDRSTLSSNRARAGGAVAAGLTTPSVSGPIRITRSRLSRNQAIGDGFGGAIAFEPVSQTSASGLFISQTLVDGNKALGTTDDTRAYGGAIAFQVIDNAGISAPLQIVRSTLSGNQAIAKGGDSAFGGAVFFEPVLNNVGSSVPLTLVNSTLSGNAALGPSSYGGAIFQQSVRNNGSSDKTLTNVTMVGNSVPGGTGGAIYTTNIASVFQPAVAFTDSIIAGNNSGVAGTSDCSEAVADGGYNLEGKVSCGLSATGDLQNTPAGLKALADNGGPTPTRPLKASSAAVNAGDPAGCVATDQRGVKRPKRGRCDIGAYELEP